MTAVARVAAQAKVNLLLRILAREESGYHAIETVFQRLDLADDVVLRVGPGVHGRTIDCLGAGVDAAALGPGAENLAYRAAALYADTTGWPGAFAIELTKRIPVGGGLGGGSADAGAVLRALDALAPAPLGTELVALASRLGSDVPFLTTEATLALAWGRGERLLPLPPLPARPVVLVVPPFGVATGAAYGWLAAERGAAVPRGCLLRLGDLATWEGVAQLAENDFTPVVSRRHRAIAEHVASLRDAGAVVAMMTGSGSAIFGVLEEVRSAEVAAAALQQSGAGATVLLTRTSDRVAPVCVER